MLRIRDHGLFLARGAAPKNEGQRLFAFVQERDNLIRENFPAMSAMGIRLMFADGQHGVQEQYALVCPRFQTAVVRDSAAEIGGKLLEDVDERRRRRDARLYGKAQPVRLPRSVVWVLPEDDDFCVGVACKVQGIKDVEHIGKNFLRTIL